MTDPSDYFAPKEAWEREHPGEVYTTAMHYLDGPHARVLTDFWTQRALLLSLENESLRDQLQEERAGIEDERGRIKDHWSALGSFKRSRRYRLAQLLGEPLDRWRRRSDS